MNKVYNNTQLTKEEIAALPVIGLTISNWRQRNITLCQHPTIPGNVISVGVTFDNSMTVIADEPKEQWATSTTSNTARST